MATNPHPTLSTDGWVHSTKNRLDAMFADFMVAAHSQYPQAKIEESLPWLIVKHQDDYQALASDVALTLRTYFSTKFTAVDITCEAKQSELRADFINLSITGVLTDEDGIVHQLNEIRDVGDSRSKMFAKVNNGTLPFEAEGY